MDFHHYAESYPLIDGEEYEAFKADIAAKGLRETVKYRVVNGTKQGLDGRNRYRACMDMGVELRLERVEVADADVESYIDSLNYHRRHLEKEFRQALVAKMRAEGKSTRVIAETLGVSQSTVHRDIARSGEPNDSPENGVLGKDGKTYSAETEKLIPALAKMREDGKLSPKVVPSLNKLSKPKQKGVLAYIQAGKNPREAIALVNQREAGDDTEAEKDAKAAAKSTPKAGAEKFTLDNFHMLLGKSIAEADKLCHEHGLLNSKGRPDCPEHKTIVSGIGGVRKTADKWFKGLKK